MSKIGKQRDIFEAAFNDVGGIEKLNAWISESSDNYKEFLKMYTKLTPPIKPDASDSMQSHDSFIKMLMREELKLINEAGKPTRLIEVDIIDAKNTDN